MFLHRTHVILMSTGRAKSTRSSFCNQSIGLLTEAIELITEKKSLQNLEIAEKLKLEKREKNTNTNKNERKSNDKTQQKEQESDREKENKTIVTGKSL